MKHILWLASWYPDARDPYDGDFIQRHAKALALYACVHVIRVKPTDNSRASEQRKDGNLSEQIFFFMRSRTPVFARYINTVRYMQLMLVAVKRYRQHNALPFVHVQVTMKAGMAAWWLKIFYGIPYVITEHYNIYERSRPDSYFRRSWLYRCVVRQIFQSSSGLISASRHIAERIQSIVPSLRYTVVTNDVDTRLFRYVDRPKSPRFVFFHASTMQPVKNVEGMLKAVALLRERRDDFELHFAGPHTPEQLRLCQSLDLQNQVTFHGELRYAEVAQLMQRGDALLMFSRWELMGCVVLESLCCGKPVVSSNVGGIPEAVNVSNGILVNDNDVPALAEAMNTVIKSHASYNQAEIAAAAQERYGYESIGRQMLAAYDELLSKK